MAYLDHDGDVEDFSYHCFDDCEHFPGGCKNCDQVMHEGYGYQDQPPVVKPAQADEQAAQPKE